MNLQQQKQLKVFGYGLPLILTVLGIRHGFKHGWDTLSYVLLALAAIVLGITLFNKPLLVKIFKLWMKGAHAIGLVITTAILVILYYLVFTPTALFLRLTGKDFMVRKLESQASSYWIVRKAADQQEYTKQF